MSLITPDGGLLFWMLIIFGLVFFILAKFGFPVITDMVEKRTVRITEAVQMANEAEKRLRNIETEQETLLQQTKKEQVRIIESASKMKEEIIAQAHEQAQVEAKKMIEQARVQIANEKEIALRDVRKEISLLAVNIAGRVLREEFGKEAVQQKYVDTVIEEISAKGSFTKGVNN